MFKRWTIVVVAGLIVVNLAMLGFIYQRHHLQNRCQVDETPLSYHSVIDQAIVKKLDGIVGGQWRYLMLAFVSTMKVTPRLKYLDILHRRYVDQGLKVVGIYNSSEDQIRTLREEARVSFSLLRDEACQLHQAFHIPPGHSHGGLVVLDEQGRIDFFAQEIPVEDQLRQLAEKYALGEINYASAQDSIAAQFKLGAPLPLLPATRLDGKEYVVIGEAQTANLALVVFTGQCASCQVEHFIDAVGLFQAKLVSDRRYRDHRLAVLFTPNFDRTMLTSYQESGKLPLSTYILSSLAPLYDEYATRYEDSGGRPIVVLTGFSGEVVAIKPLSVEEEDK